MFQIMLWEPKTGKKIGRTLTGHRQWITALSWRPLHLFVIYICVYHENANKLFNNDHILYITSNHCIYIAIYSEI